MVTILAKRPNRGRSDVEALSCAALGILIIYAASVFWPEDLEEFPEPLRSDDRGSIPLREIPSPYCSVLRVDPSGRVDVVQNSSEPLVNPPVLGFFKERVKNAVEEKGPFSRSFYFDIDTSDTPTCIGRMPSPGESCRDMNTEAGCCSAGRPLVGITRNICCECSLPLPIHGNQMPKALADIIEMKDPYAWKDKIPLAVWHGSNTGNIDYVQFYMKMLNMKGNAYSTPRENLVSIAHQHPDIIHASMQKRPLEDLLKYKFIVTASGYAYAGLLKSALMSNSCVLRQDAIATEWYEPWLVPYVHFVPVKFDMSDLVEKVKWSIEHDKECELIAQQGTLFAKKHFHFQAVNEFLHKAISGETQKG